MQTHRLFLYICSSHLIIWILDYLKTLWVLGNAQSEGRSLPHLVIVGWHVLGNYPFGKEEPITPGENRFSDFPDRLR